MGRERGSIGVCAGVCIGIPVGVSVRLVRVMAVEKNSGGINKVLCGKKMISLCRLDIRSKSVCGLGACESRRREIAVAGR